MRAPPAAGRRAQQNLWWRWRWRAVAGVSGWKKKRTRKTRRRPNPTALLTDDLLVEILARAPYRSLCRFRCVCARWRDLIDHPDNRARLPQALTGFLYRLPFDAAAGGSPASPPPRYGFANVSGTEPPFIDTSFLFLPDRKRERLVLVDCCNGLLLCRRYMLADDHELDYLVLNPATEKWVTVPLTQRWPSQMVLLGFDPAVSPHFYVFEFQVDDEDGFAVSVKIYSSGTGFWIHKKTDWSIEILLQMHFKSVFLKGVLYVNATGYAIGALDVEEETCRIIDFPFSNDSPFCDLSSSFIDQSQGQLHLARTESVMVGDNLAIYVLADKDSEGWTLKHTVSFEHLVGTKNVYLFDEFIVVAIHPDRNMVFFVFGHQRTLMSYDMDSGKVCTIHNLGCSENGPFLSYVPLFSKTLPDGGNY